MKHLKKFNEEVGNPRHLSFIQKLNSLFDFSEYEEGDEPSNIDLLSQIGDLCNEFELKKQDIDDILANYTLDSDAKHLLSIVNDNQANEVDNKKTDTTDPYMKEAKDFAEWLRHTCVILSDEGYYYDGKTYGIDEIYKIYKEG